MTTDAEIAAGRSGRAGASTPRLWGARTRHLGRVEEIGDGIATDLRLAGCPARRISRFRHGTVRIRPVLERDASVASCSTAPTRSRRAMSCAAPATCCAFPWAGRCSAGSSIPWAVRSTARAPSTPKLTADRTGGAGSSTAILSRSRFRPACRGRRDVRAWARPARAHHRRPRHRQDHDRRRTIINQRSSDIVCIYVAVGQKSSSVRRAIEAIETHGAPQRCIFVVAESAGAPGLQWIAPFAGFTMAEYFRDRGEHALIVIDDLSKHAASHREIALLTRQSPGREAYPGDVFYVHARLLERAAKLRPTKAAGR